MRYDRFLIALHWVMALSFIGMLLSGFFMANWVFLKELMGFDIADPVRWDFYKYHKAVGVILLVSFFLRLATHIVTLKPKWPERFSAFDKKAAKYGHYALYVFMITLPLSGWAMSSAFKGGSAITVFGLFDFPKMPFVFGNETVLSWSKDIHFYGAIIFASIISLHIGAVIKHKMKDKINILPRMWFK